MTREEFNEKARRDAKAFRKELTALGVETEVAAQDTDEDYFVHLVREAICYAYSNDPQVQPLADLKALLLLGVDANILRRIDAAFTPEITGERAHDEYFSNVMIPRLGSLGDDCPSLSAFFMARLSRNGQAAGPGSETRGRSRREKAKATFDRGNYANVVVCHVFGFGCFQQRRPRFRVTVQPAWSSLGQDCLLR